MRFQFVTSANKIIKLLDPPLEHPKGEKLSLLINSYQTKPKMVLNLANVFMIYKN